MTIWEQYLAWHALFGVVWVYLLLHEEITGESYFGTKADYLELWKSSHALCVLAALIALVVALILVVVWPISLIVHVWNGKLKALFT